MNKVMITARLVKGFTEKDVAKQLKIDDVLYKEIESGVRSIDTAMSQALETLYDVPAYYFMAGCTDIQTAIDALEKQKKIISESTDIQNISLPAQLHISLAKMALDSLIAKQQNIQLLVQTSELLTEKKVLIELYEAESSKNSKEAAAL